MNIDNLLILAAGHGTRMGKVGEVLPKPLWPVFNQPLILAQILFWKKFNPKRIFINVHHCGEKITEFIQRLNDPTITILEEKELLGSAGPFYTVKKILKNKDELLWAVNADSLSNISDELVELMNQSARRSHGVLLAQSFNENESYNRFALSGDKLVGIKNKNEAYTKTDSRITFSGISCFNLSKMESLEGPQSFFETVSNYNKKEISVIGPVDIETYDFGTIDNYVKEHLALTAMLNNKSATPFALGLVRLGIIPDNITMAPFLSASEFVITDEYQLITGTKKSDEGVLVTYKDHSSTSLIQSTGQACSHN